MVNDLLKEEIGQMHAFSQVSSVSSQNGDTIMLK
jgi:stress-induced morphogen